METRERGRVPVLDSWSTETACLWTEERKWLSRWWNVEEVAALYPAPFMHRVTWSTVDLRAASRSLGGRSDPSIEAASKS